MDYDGGMLSQSWEPYAETLANCPNESFMDVLYGLMKDIKCEKDAQPVVIIGRDTRPHSLELATCVKLGVESWGGIVHDLGIYP